MTWARRVRRAIVRRLRGPHGDAGFTLLEAIVAMTLAAIMLTSVAYAGFAGLSAAVTTKRNQQATALGSQAIEVAREVDWDKLAMWTGDLVVTPPTAANYDAAILTTCGSLTGNRFFDPDGTGPLTCEQIVHTAAGGAVGPQHIETDTVAGTTYTVKRYVTCTVALDAESRCAVNEAASTKRVVSVVEWRDRGRPHSLRSTTLVTRALRGLPVPKFTVTPTSQTRVAEPPSTVAFPHLISNLGIPDDYEITATILPSTPTRTWTVRFYLDANSNGIYESATDTTQLTNSDGNGGADSPAVPTSETLRFFAVWDLPTGETFGAATVRVDVASGVDSTVVRSTQNNLVVGLLNQVLYLHNRPARVGATPPSADTNIEFDMPMDTDQPSASSLVLYSADAPNNLGCSTTLGRCIEPSSAGAASDPSTNQNKPRIANWVNQLSADTTLNGVATLQLSTARPAGACGGPLNYTAFLRTKAAASDTAGTLLATAIAPAVNLTGTTPCQPAPVNFSFALNNALIPASRWLEVKVVLLSGSVGPGMLAYDTSAFPASLVLPVV